MKTIEKYAAFLFAFVILALFAGCKSKPIEASPYVAETHDASNPFVGLWELKMDGFSRLIRDSNGSIKNNVRRFYKFTNTNRYEFYVFQDGVISHDSTRKGTYSYRPPFLHIMYDPIWYPGELASHVTMVARFDSGVIKFNKNQFSLNQYTLHPASADDNALKQILEQWPSYND
jgi:hypothetical protein